MNKAPLAGGFSVPAMRRFDQVITVGLSMPVRC